MNLVVPRSRRAFLAKLDPQQVWRLVDIDNTTGPYASLYTDLRDAYLEQYGPNTVNIAALIGKLDDCLVESAFSEAGFVLGFEVCRQLLLGELDLDALREQEDSDGSDGAQ